MDYKFADGFREGGKIKVFTIPNVLSMFRICLIPVFIYMYMAQKNTSAFFVLVLSGITDVADGFIARRFNMISPVGKALDPLSDKLTQTAMLFCLLGKFKAMAVPFILMIIKELFSGAVAFVAIKKTGEVCGADWHGKMTTVLLYGMMALHIVWQTIPPVLSNLLVGVCVLSMLMSLVLYSMRNIGMARDSRKKMGEKI